MVLLIAAMLQPGTALADGMFVAPKFVWDKHKDINEPTQKAVLVYDNGREDLILQVKYEGPVNEFGWLIPVPNQPTIQAGSMKCFYELSQYTQRRFDHYWGVPSNGAQSVPGSLSTKGTEKAEPPVKVIEIKTVGAYDIAVLSTKDSGALEKWLSANQFYFPVSRRETLDNYVNQHWYFVAVRINVSKSGGFRLLAATKEARTVAAENYITGSKLASGELNPLQISFDSDRCVFPLKISSINGRASEVQVYVLSPQPLLEKTMLEKKLPLIYSNNLAMAARRAQSMRNLRLLELATQIHAAGGTPHGPASLPPLSPQDEKILQQAAETPQANPGDLLPFAKVSKADLPETSRWISRLTGRTWWLTKQTWKFEPEEMRDLVFEPALPVFGNMLGSKYGYFAAASLTSFGTDAVPVILAAMQNTNPTVRISAAGNFNDGFWGSGSFAYGPIRDSRLTEAALRWLKDSEPAVRYAGVQTLTGNWNPQFAEPLIATLRDDDAAVRRAAAFTLPRFRSDMEKYIPAFQQMLNDKNPAIEWSGLEMLQRLQVEIPREDLLHFFNSSDPETLGVAFSQLTRQNERVSDADALVLLQNPQPLARVLGLRVLDRNHEKQSVELALPLLLDSEELVRLKATQTLRALTGQEFSEDQTEEWSKWWMEHKTNFVAQASPEEWRPQIQNSDDDEKREATWLWQHTDKRQTEVEKLLNAPPPTSMPDVKVQGRSLSKSLRNSSVAGANKLSLRQMLTLKQIITGEEPESITFELPVVYNTVTNLGEISLMVDPNYDTADEEGSGAEQTECNQAPNGNCLLVWHTIYESPGKHALQAAFFLKEHEESDKPDAVGPYLPFSVSNLCQFSLGSATFDTQRGAIFHARLPEMNGLYSIECVSTNGELLKTLAGNATNGEFKVVWNLVDDHGRRFNGETFNSMVHITLPGSGRSQTLKGP